MKNLILILVMALLTATVSNAQYNLNKTKYDYKTYSYQPGDPYRPPVAGVSSLFLPGLGQMISGEPARGIAFMGGFAGSILLSAAGFGILVKSNPESEHEETSIEGTVAGALMILTGIVCAIGIDIWSVSDAVKVAKVNNMVFRDNKKSGYNLSVKPYFVSTSTENMQIGLSMKLHF